jgi:hypothetical protein
MAAKKKTDSVNVTGPSEDPEVRLSREEEIPEEHRLSGKQADEMRETAEQLAKEVSRKRQP